MKFLFMLCLLSLATNTFAQEKALERPDPLRFVTVKYHQPGDDFQITDKLAGLNGKQQVFWVPGKNLVFSSGNGIIVQDMERLKKLLGKEMSALFMPLHTSVPDSLTELLAPKTIVILRRDPNGSNPYVNPIFANRELEQRGRSIVPYDGVYIGPRSKGESGEPETVLELQDGVLYGGKIELQDKQERSKR